MFCLKCTGRHKCVPLQDNRLSRVTVCTVSFIPKLGKQRQWPASHCTSFTLAKKKNSKQYTLNRKLGGNQNQSAQAAISPQWLLAFDYDDWSKQHRNAVTWLLAHMILHKFQSSRKLTLINTWSFCDVPAVKPSAGGNISGLYCHHLDKAF